jgi:DNA-binding PadR family transcriptional regulator
MPRRPVDDEEIKPLRVLHELARTDAGWRRARVRGWALGTEVNCLADSVVATFHLQRLRQAGWVHSERVLDPGRLRAALLMWRITQAGANELARIEDRAAITVTSHITDRRDSNRIYFGRDAWRCLSVLQSQPGAIAWSELVDQFRRRFGGGVWEEDAQMLLNRHLATRESSGFGRTRVVRYMATATGRATRLTDGRTNREIVQVHLPVARHPA